MKQRETDVDRLRDRVSDDDAIKESLRERVAALTDELADANAGGEEAALKEKMQQRLGDELAAAFAELQVGENWLESSDGVISLSDSLKLLVCWQSRGSQIYLHIAFKSISNYIYARLLIAAHFLRLLLLKDKKMHIMKK